MTKTTKATITPLPSEPIRRFGWLPDKPDQRDRVFDHARVLRRLRQRLPSKVDLRPTGFLSPLPRQGNLGSCTANADAVTFRYRQRRQGLVDYDPSRLFIYYGEREIEGSIPYDAGAYIRDGLKVLNKQGAPHESLWPYNIKHQAITYESVEVKTTAFKAALASDHPVIVGFSVYTSFFDIGANGFMPVPKATERVEGGHAVVGCGYARMRAPWDSYAYDYGIFANWWDDESGPWGDDGFFYGRLGWMCDRRNADDFWTITSVES
jgi:C1A family cysteine protease